MSGGRHWRSGQAPMGCLHQDPVVPPAGPSSEMDVDGMPDQAPASLCPPQQASGANGPTPLGADSAAPLEASKLGRLQAGGTSGLAVWVRLSKIYRCRRQVGRGLEDRQPDGKLGAAIRK